MTAKSFQIVLFLFFALTYNALFGTGPWSWAVGFTYIGYDSFLVFFIIYQMLKVIRLEKDTLVQGVPSATRPTLAVIITARNEARVLHDCLNAIDAQTDLPDSVYWIDDGSTDETHEHFQKFQFKYLKNFHTVFKTHSGKASSLNQVWPSVDAEVIVTLDADTLLEEDAISEIRKEFGQKPNLAITGGLLTPRSIHKPGSFFENFQRFEYMRSFLARRAWMNKNALVLVSGAFSAYRKKALIEVNGYDEKSLVEDYDLTHRIYRYSYDHNLGYEVHVTMKARAFTDVPVTLKRFLKQRQRWFAGFLETHFKNEDMVGNKTYGPVGRYMLVVKSADTMQPIYGIVTISSLFLIIFSRRMVYAIIWKVLLAKILLDLIFQFWSVGLYFKWQNQNVKSRTWVLAVMATFLEPLTFQVIRHVGALMGWEAYLKGKFEWTPQR